METRKNGKGERMVHGSGVGGQEKTNDKERDRRAINEDRERMNVTQEMLTHVRISGQETTLTTTFPPHVKLLAPSANT